MNSSSRCCPCLVGLSLPPCSLLVVRSGGNFRLVVSGGGLPYLHCWWAFDDGSRSPPLSFLLSVSTFLIFAAVVFLRISWVLISFTLSSVGLGFLRWTIPPSLPSPTFADGSGGLGVLGFRGSGSLSSHPALFVLSAFLFPGGTLGLVFNLLVYIIFI